MRIWTRVTGFFLFLSCLFSACAPAATPVPPTNTALPSPTPAFLTPVPEAHVWALGKSFIDVHYCTDDDLPLKMTLIVPAEPLRDPPPILLHLKFSSELVQPLLRRGFAVMNIEWREPPDFKLPVGTMDVKCAIRYLRANAAQFNVDANHIGLFGCSRGGHMGALVGVTGPEDGMEGDYGFADQSSRVQAVMMFDGIADFRTNYDGLLSELSEVHGIGSYDDPMIQRLSPITYASPDDPPFLLIASMDVHWQEQAHQLEKTLSAQGVPVTYLQAEGANHCQYAQAGPHTLEKMSGIVADFFEETLK
jgi:dienelactone hydrolase